MSWRLEHRTPRTSCLRRMTAGCASGPCLWWRLLRTTCGFESSFLVRVDHPNSWKKRPENAGPNGGLSCGFPSVPRIALGVAPRIAVFVLPQVVRWHSENGISHSENQSLNSESCSESTPELSESSEHGLVTPRAFFLKLGWSPGLRPEWPFTGVSGPSGPKIAQKSQKESF